MNQVIGIDEVGRGCWAGPLVACATVIHTSVEGLKDSKKLTPMQRQKLSDELIEAASFGLGWVTPQEIDQIGLTASVSLAMKRAVDELSEVLNKGLNDYQIIIDGNYNFLPQLANVTTMIKADDSVPAVSAASTIAKVARDNYMKELSLKFKEYGFDSHVGYGTSRHLNALKEFGVTEHHRRSFKPIKSLINEHN